MSKLLEFIRTATGNSEEMNAKIVARLGDEFGADKITMAENLIRAVVAGAFAAAPPKARVHSMTILCALYCSHCGEPQPDDPKESCRCIERH